MLLSDFCVYWGHRLQHRVDFLWRFHAVHHSDENLDWLAAHREHPIDSIYTIALINLPAFLLGFPLQTLAGFVAFRGIWAIYIHSNVRLPIGPLRWFIGAPELHHWHHHRSKDAGNYANLSPLMDLMFGTYKCPDHEPDRLGIEEPFPRSYLGQLVYPLIPRWWKSARQALTKNNNEVTGALAGSASDEPAARDSGAVLENGCVVQSHDSSRASGSPGSPPLRERQTPSLALPANALIDPDVNAQNNPTISIAPRIDAESRTSVNLSGETDQSITPQNIRSEPASERMNVTSQ